MRLVELPQSACFASAALLGIAVALAAWLPAGLHGQLALIWSLPIVWMLCAARPQVFFLMLGYCLVMQRDIAAVISAYTGMAGTAAWCAVAIHSTAIAGLWAAAWHQSPLQRSLRLFALLVVTSVPPLAAIGFGSPLLASGWLFPGSGLMGLLLTCATWATFAAWQHRKHRDLVAGVAFILVSISVLFNVNFVEPVAPVVWMAVPTQLTEYPAAKSKAAQYQRQAELTGLADAALKVQQASLVVLPEEIGGYWQDSVAWLWLNLSRQYPSKTLITGFDLTTNPGQAFKNAAVVIQDGQVIAMPSARIPVPIGSWKPWSAPHAPMQWLDSGLIHLQGHSAAVFFCYEELVLWPWLVSAIHSQGGPQPLAMILVNHWFAAGTDIGDSQNRSSEAWARLFGWPRIRAVNAAPVALQTNTQ